MKLAHLETGATLEGAYTDEDSEVRSNGPF